MENWLFGVIGILILVVLGLLGRLVCLRSAIREVAEELDEKMHMDTNTLISISSLDPTIRQLAAGINDQLRVLRDERRRLQNGDAELKTAVTNISHDLRTPLTAISGYLELLEKEPLSQPAARYTAIIRERTEALKTLTEELFHFSVITSTAGTLDMRAVSINGALEETLAAFYGALTERGIVPEIQMPEHPVVRQLDTTALRRIFGNLLSNALKYSDGDLRITLEPDGTLTFANRAGRLNPVQAEKLFDRFYTVSSARNSTGLGLSIARLLTEKMGGSIEADYRNGQLRIVVRFP